MAKSKYNFNTTPLVLTEEVEPGKDIVFDPTQRTLEKSFRTQSATETSRADSHKTKGVISKVLLQSALYCYYIATLIPSLKGVLSTFAVGIAAGGVGLWSPGSYVLATRDQLSDAPQEVNEANNKFEKNSIARYSTGALAVAAAVASAIFPAGGILLGVTFLFTAASNYFGGNASKYEAVVDAHLEPSKEMKAIKSNACNASANSSYTAALHSLLVPVVAVTSFFPPVAIAVGIVSTVSLVASYAYTSSWLISTANQYTLPVRKTMRTGLLKACSFLTKGANAVIGLINRVANKEVFGPLADTYHGQIEIDKHRANQDLGVQTYTSSSITQPEASPAQKKSKQPKEQVNAEPTQSNVNSAGPKILKGKVEHLVEEAHDHIVEWESREDPTAKTGALLDESRSYDPSIPTVDSPEQVQEQLNEVSVEDLEKALEKKKEEQLKAQQKSQDHGDHKHPD